MRRKNLKHPNNHQLPTSTTNPMKLFAISRFELSYQLRQPITWLFFIALIVISYLNTGDESVADALYEDLFLNSPFTIAKTTVIGTFIWLVMAATIAGTAAARDVATNIYPLTYSTPITKTQYLGGRFLAALTINIILLLGVQAGIAIAIFSSNTNPESIAPFGVAPFATAFLIISLPNAFFATSLQFWLATRSGRPTTSYFGSFILFFMGFFIAAMLLFYQNFGSLVDPIGIRYIIEDLAHNWTPTERRDRLLSLEGTVLTNRILWLSIGLIVLAITYLQFQFNDRSLRKKTSWWKRKKLAITGVPTPDAASIAIPQVNRSFTFTTYISQTLTLAWRPFRTTWLSRTGLIFIIVIPILAFIVVINKVDAGGVPRIPTTPLIITELAARFSDVLSPWAIIPFLIVIISGEMVWRERDARMNDLTDVMPTSEWSLLIGKFMSVGLMIAMLMILMIIGGMLTQLKLGFHEFNLQLYFGVMFGLQLPEYLLFATLIVVVHVVVNNKYIAHLVAIVVSVIIVMPQLFGIEHRLLIYNSAPQWSYSEMRGFGASLPPWLWFKLYWCSWALLLAVAAQLLWTRGKDHDISVRLQLARRRFTGATRLVTTIAGMLVVGFGAFIFYNTNILNVYLTSDDYNKILAQYEKRYKQYEYVPQPGLINTKLNVDLYPARGLAQIEATYETVNNSNAPIDSVHLAIVPGAEISNITFNRPFAAALLDDDHGHRIYKLDQPLLPGDSLQLRFNLEVERHGFGNGGVYEAVVDNGTFFTNRDWLPQIGYQSSRELRTATDRREHGLPQKQLIPPINDTRALMTKTERAGLDITIATDPDQVAVTTGALQKSWVDNDRRYFHYKTDSPIGNDFVFFSARYDVSEFQWKDVDVRMYYHPTHKAIVGRMEKSVRASLEHYTKHFGAYPHKHLTYAEVRGNEIGMHADETMIRFSEGTALWNPDSFDLPFSVVAHELAHQWWGHKLEAAFVEGAPVLSETLAVFSSMQVFNETFGRDQLHRLLAFMRKPFPYAPIRHGEPLLRAIDPYLAYRKGPFALHALGEHIGSGRVEDALQNLINNHPTGKLPLATTSDLYQELKAVTPDSLQTFLHDLFEVNTLWQFRVERAYTNETPNSTWDLTLEVKSTKIVVSETGVETEALLNDWVEIAVFDETGKPVYVRKHLITSELQTIKVNLDKKPSRAGIDPYHVLDWEEREDDENIRRVKTGY